MVCVPLLASRLALVSVLAGVSALAGGCGGSAPSPTGGSASSGDAAASSAVAASSSGSGGSASSSSGAGGSGGGSAASSSTGAGGSASGSTASSSGASGSSGASSGSASTGGGPTGSLGDPCATGADCALPPPGASLFCDKPGCGAGAGTCALQPGSQIGLSAASAPVCGCDHVTYWNADYASFHGTSVASPGACPGATSLACDDTTPCPGTMKCNRQVIDQTQCTPRAAGTCWSMPVACPLGGAAAHACSDASCQSTCDLIQSQNPWWSDSTCQ